MPDSVRRDIEAFAERLGAGARVLEIGSGGGRDARLMEELGLRVRRTDITPGFVALLRAEGHDADVLDPLTDDLASPEGAVRRRVGQRLAAARRPGRPARRCSPRLAAVSRRRRAAADLGQGGRRRGVVDARLDQQPAALHLLARRRPARRAWPAAGWRDVEIVHQPGTKNAESWLEVSAVRA